MSKYTTGEMAKLCGVTVRTVQYYDTRGILIPSEISEGGRRLYSEDDPDRNPGHGAAMVFHHFLDRQRYLVAVCRLGTGGYSLGDTGQPVLL